jgi:hypothetical protein
MKSGIQEDCVYPDRADLIFRNQNTHAARYATEKWRSRSSRITKTPESSAGSPGSTTSPATNVSEDNLEELALNRFFFDWTFQPDVIKTNGVAFLHYIPDFYSRCEPGSFLSKAVKAVAYANYAQRYQVFEARHRAIENCTAALRLVAAVMENPDQSKVDETLSSIILLGIYEVRIIEISIYSNLRSSLCIGSHGSYDL